MVKNNWYKFYDVRSLIKKSIERSSIFFLSRINTSEIYVQITLLMKWSTPSQPFTKLKVNLRGLQGYDKLTFGSL